MPITMIICSCRNADIDRDYFLLDSYMSADDQEYINIYEYGVYASMYSVTCLMRALHCSHLIMAISIP